MRHQPSQGNSIDLNDATSKDLLLETSEHIPDIFGTQDLNLKQIEKKFNVRVTTRENHIKINGAPKDVEAVERLLLQLEEIDGSRQPVAKRRHQIRYSAGSGRPGGQSASHCSVSASLSPQKKVLSPPRETNQREMIRSIRDNDVVLAIGPAGTGKTYLAVAMAVEGFLKHQYKRIILTRPGGGGRRKTGLPAGRYR